jgi:cytochrome c
LIWINRVVPGPVPNNAEERKEGSNHMIAILSRPVLATAAALALVAGSAQAQVDTSAAEALLKKSGCMKCHSVSAKKEGPPFKETAAKYKGKPDAQKALVTHLTTNPKVKIDGKEELHDSLKTKNDAEIRNVVQYILSR